MTDNRITICLVILPLLLILFFPLKQLHGADFFVHNGTGTACSMADPCHFSLAQTNASNGDTIYFKTGTYEYTGIHWVPDLFVVNKSLSLLGGWNGASSGPIVRDHEAYPTILNGNNFRRVIKITGLISPTIDGFTIQNGNASGLATNCSAYDAEGCGGGIFVYRAGARISNNKILSNKALASSNVNVTGYGGGIHLEEASGSVIEGNLIQGNQANPTGTGMGGGLSIYGVTQNTIQVNGNQFIDNSATYFGGMMSILQTDLVIHDNLFDHNSALMAAGLGIFGRSVITNNTFHNQQGQETIHLAAYQGFFENNTVVDNNTNTGINMLSNGNPPFPRLSNNIVAASGTNAVITAGTQQNPLFATLEHNTLVGGDVGAAITIPAGKYATLSLTNNIIAGFPVGLENNTFPDSTVTARYTLFGPEVTTPGVNVSLQNSIIGDPAFKNPGVGDYHIRFTSAAKDAGSINFIATQDYDGDLRPIGSAPDIGADEYQPAGYLYLPLIER
jgi:hypothetical protein